MEGAGIEDPLLTSSIQYIINVAMTIPAIIWMDRWGRRPTLLLGSFGMMTWLFISGSIQGAFGEPENDPTRAVTWVMVDKETQARAVVACSYLFVATFAVTWGPVSWTMPAEVFPNKVRAKAVSLSTASNWAVSVILYRNEWRCFFFADFGTEQWNCGLAFAVPPLLRAINWRMYMIFATFNGCALIHMFFTAPETKGKTLEEMDDVFDVSSSSTSSKARIPTNSLTERYPSLACPAQGLPSRRYPKEHRGRKPQGQPWRKRPPNRDRYSRQGGLSFFSLQSDGRCIVCSCLLCN